MPSVAPVALPVQSTESTATVNGRRIVITQPSPDLTLPPTDPEFFESGSGDSSTLGGVLVLLGGLLVLAAAMIARSHRARR